LSLNAPAVLNEPVSRDPEADAAPVRVRFLLASLLIVVFALLSLARAMQEPSLGYRFVETAAGIEARPTTDRGPVLRQVRALDGSGGMRVPLSALLMTESAGILNLYAEHEVFFSEHARLWQLLQGPQVRIEHALGLTTAPVRPRELDELGPRFWFPWVVALMSLSVGLAVWVFRPGDVSARWYMLASLGYAFGMLCTAGWGSRLLTQAPELWQELHLASHAGSFLVLGGLCMLLWRHPSALGLPWFPWVLGSVCAASLLVDGARLVDSIALGFRLPVVLIGVALTTLYGLQWRASQDDPVKRAQIKWLGLLLFAALSVVFVAYAFGAMGYVVRAPQNYGLGWVALVFVGLVPLVTRVGLFRLDRWWATAWLWFFGGLLVVALDMLLLVLLPLSGETALAAALALGGWLYFPLRQALWRRLARGVLPATRDVLPDIVALMVSGTRPGQDASMQARWIQLWDRVFQPQHLRPCIHEGEVGIAGDGRVLRVPGVDGLGGLELRLAARGARLFNPGDLRRAAEIVQLVRQGLAARASYERGAVEERERIAADLHDDLGARLLGIVQSAEAAQVPRVAALARQAMDDMRLSVRGMTGRPVPASVALADWRAELVGRLDAAGFEASWEARVAPDDPVLPSRLHLQVTRVLREAVSNVIRHSGGHVCRITLVVDEHTLTLDVEDDGSGLDGARRAGMGLPGMERRARNLGGNHWLGRSALGGAQVHLSVPLYPTAEADPAPQHGSSANIDA
jgi:signal transduction histidine kinase